MDVYLADGTKIDKNDEDAWEFDDSVSLTSGEFYTYAENDDGFIEVEDADALKDDATYVWDDQTGWISGEVDPDSAWDQDMMSITATNLIEDIKLDNAKIVDLHDTSEDGGEYDKEIRTVARLQQLLDDDKIEDVVVAMNVSKDGVSTIFLLSVAEKAGGSTPTPPAVAASDIDISGLTLTANYDAGTSTSGVELDATPAVKAGITFSYAWASPASGTNATATVPHASLGTNGDVTVTCTITATGDGTTYTGSVTKDATFTITVTGN